MKFNQIKKLAVFTLLLAVVFGCSPEAKIDYQLHKASVDMSKAFRQFQKADNAFLDSKNDAALRHLTKGQNLLQSSLNHLSKVEDEAYKGASNEIDQGNNELQKSIDAYNNGNSDSAAKHYNDALEYYDKALDLLGS